METTEEHERAGRSGISNVYYGQVNKVINLRLDGDQMDSLYDDIREMITGEHQERGKRLKPVTLRPQIVLRVGQAEINVNSPGNQIVGEQRNGYINQ